MPHTFAWQKIITEIGTIFDPVNCQFKLEIIGKNLTKVLNEVGNHRIQRVPPTERYGRVHTSSVTVAIIDTQKHNSNVTILDSDFRIEWFSGTGKGGQHRNKKQNSCRVIHIPTGLIECRQGRKRESNLREAKEALINTLITQNKSNNDLKISETRRSQVGSGDRNDKIRTYRFKDNIVIDHITNKKAKCTKILKGEFNLLWK